MRDPFIPNNTQVVCKLTVRNRIDLEALETKNLSLCASRSAEATRRIINEDEDIDLCTAYQRDRDRILRTRSFRSLKHKTQVYMPLMNHHPRNRLTHTLEVTQLGFVISRALGLNGDLVEAVALAHDLGHIAFGHSGERTLSSILAGKAKNCQLPAEIISGVGTFKHNYQSLRVVDLLEHRSEPAGLNLTDQVREGILKHTKWHPDFPFPLPDNNGLRLNYPCHLEGQVVALADELAQQTHDLEDGLEVNSVSLNEVESLPIAKRLMDCCRAKLQKTSNGRVKIDIFIHGLIDLLLNDAIVSTLNAINYFLAKKNLKSHEDWIAFSDEIPYNVVDLSPEISQEFAQLKDFVYSRIINHNNVYQQDFRATRIVEGLFRAYYSNPLTLPSDLINNFSQDNGRLYLRDLDQQVMEYEIRDYYHHSVEFVRLIVDHLAEMSDREALEEYESLYDADPVDR